MSKKFIPSPMTFEEFSSKTPRTYADMFETRTCGRCGGCGEYSFNLMYGTRCFGCNGSGIKFTPRGKRQFAAYKAMQSKPASEIKLGDKIKPDGYKNFACPHEINPAPSYMRVGETWIDGITFVFSNVSLTLDKDSVVLVALTLEEAYQNYVKALSA